MTHSSTDSTDGGDSHSENDYDFSSEGGGLSVSDGTSGGMGLSFGSGLGSSMDMARSLSATMSGDVPVMSISPGSGHSPGFTYTSAKRQKRSGSFGSLHGAPGMPVGR